MEKNIIDLATDYLNSLSAEDRGRYRFMPNALRQELAKLYPTRKAEIEDAAEDLFDLVQEMCQPTKTQTDAYNKLIDKFGVLCSDIIDALELGKDPVEFSDGPEEEFDED